MTKKTGDRTIVTDSGEVVPAMFPVVVSASRSTDIPAFYADWFVGRLKKGYSAWTNPFNGKKSYVAYADTRFVVFWSKNPKPLIKHIDYLKEREIGCYVQFTLNDYADERLEPGVPPLDERIDTFRRLTDKLGTGAVVWRYDPLILTDSIDADRLLDKIGRIGDRLRGYTEKLVFSFADIESYRKVRANLERSRIRYADWTTEQMTDFARRLVELNKSKGWNYELATCGEAADLDGVAHNRCIDDRLMVRLGHKSQKLMEFLGAEICLPMFDGAVRIDENLYAAIGRNNRDKGQRAACGCAKSKDIGQYDTCPHLCEYCYANSSKQLAVANWRRHLAAPDCDTITADR